MNRKQRRAQAARNEAINEIVMAAGLEAMGDAIIEEVGPDTSFALFVDWRDGQPLSYVSDVPRPRIIPVLEEWLTKTSTLDERVWSKSEDAKSHGDAPLERKCEELGKSMIEEDIDVVLFLVTWGDDGGVAWFTSMDHGRRVVTDWVKSEKVRS